MKTKLLKFNDNLVRILLGSIMPKKHPKSSDKIKNILIIRPGGLGDALLLLKAINNLKQSNLGINIDILCEKRNRAAFDLIDGINKIHIYDDTSTFISLPAKYKTYDLVIDTEQWHFLSSMLARYLGKLAIGFNTNARYKNFDFFIDYFHKIYEQAMFERLFDSVSKKLNLNYARYPISLKCKKTTLSYDIVVFTGASVWQRKWQQENYISIVNKLAPKYSICLIGGKKEMVTNKEIYLKTDKKIDNLTAKRSLSEVCGLFQNSKLLFATDSAILHLGAIAGIKTISLFGPGIEKKWAPKGKNHTVINKHLSCSPCTKFGYMKKCKNNAECIKGITVEEVREKIEELIEMG